MTVPVGVPATPELLEELRISCAEIVEIPLDEVTVEADLTADLGIDSLTLDEFLVLVLERYGLSDHARNIQSMSFPTLTALADLIQGLNRGQPNAADSGAEVR